MKKLFTLISLFLGIFTVSAQIPFPSANAVWTQRHGNGEAPPSYSVIGMKTDYISVGTNTYQKLFLSTNDTVLDALEYIGGIREDAMQRVYYYSAVSASERLLYDFSLSVGDTIFSPTGSSPVGIVYSVDTIVIGGVDHKRINFRQLTATTLWTEGSWIEGLGNSSLGGLLGNPMMQPTCDCATNTVCFKKVGESATGYHNPQYASIDCDNVFATSGVAQRQVVDAAISLFPNPVTGTSHLQIAGGQYKKLLVWDLLGKNIQTIYIAGGSKVVLHKIDFAPGIYMYQLESVVGGTVRGKFVVE